MRCCTLVGTYERTLRDLESPKHRPEVPDSSADAVVEYWRALRRQRRTGARSGSYGEEADSRSSNFGPPCHRCGSGSVEDDGKTQQHERNTTNARK